MRTKLFLIAFLTTLIFNGCTKESNSNFVQDIDSPSVIFKYHGKEYNSNKAIFETPEQVSFVVSENLVYLFDNHEEFEEWAKTTEYANKITQLENKRKSILEFANFHNTLGEFYKSGIIQQDFIDYCNSLENSQQSNKSDFSVSLNSEKYGKGDNFVVLNKLPYAFLIGFDNQASSVSGGLTFVITLYENIFFGGKSIILLIVAPDLSIFGFNNKTSSVISL